MYNIIPLFLILLSLFVVIVIITRKFSVLANLDIDTIQSEKEAKFKEQIISNRLKRNIIRYHSKLVNILKPVGSLLLGSTKKFYEKLLNFKDSYNKDAVLEPSSDNFDLMMEDAKNLIKEEKLEEAEKKFIEIISLDSQNLEAFKGLGKLYIDKKQYTEAKQTFEHVLRLLEHDEFRDTIVSADGNIGDDGQRENKHYISSIHYELSKACLSSEERKEALGNIKKAVEIEPNNPRYLDMKFEISIINKDKITALEALEKLKEVNPDNNKLQEFADKIKEL